MNTLYYGDNLDILREHIPDESVDLIYLDPPFNSNRSYNVLFREKTGEESPAQIKAFTDTLAGKQFEVPPHPAMYAPAQRVKRTEGRQATLDEASGA